MASDRAHGEDVTYISIPTISSEEDEKENDTAAIQCQGWPKAPMTLAEGQSWRGISIAKDVLFVGVASMFIALAIIACRLDGSPVSHYGSQVQAATRLGPTVFPIVFAACASATIRGTARMLIQQGATVGVLEQLLNSQSLAGTVTWLIELHYVHAVAPALILIWALSPLGGQSALRLLSVEDMAIKTTQQVSYASLNASNGWLWTSSVETARPAMVAYYSATLLGAEGNRQEMSDIWGNPKIPIFDSLRGNNSDWRQVDAPENTQYASLAGIRLQGLCKDCNLTMSIETSYNTLACHNLAHNVDFADVMNYIGPDFRGWSPVNRTEPFVGHAEQVNQAVYTSSFIGSSNYIPRTVYDTAWILFVARGVRIMPDTIKTTLASIYNCTLETQRVEAETICKEGSCGVHRVRPSLVDTRPRRWTYLHEAALGFNAFCGHFPWASGYPRFRSPTATDMFLSGNVAPFNTTDYTFPDWATVADTALSQRLTMALNMMHHTDLAPFTLSDGYTFQPLRCTSDSAQKSNPGDGCDLIDFTTAEISRNTRIYRASKVWVSLLLLTSIFMLLLGIASIMLQCLNTVPDILGYVSTLTRDNPYVELPTNASVLGGPERTRLLRNLRIQLTDVQPYADIGRLAVRSVKQDEPAAMLKHTMPGRRFE
ncbi:hypothetical protein E8E13_000190 [Curvularia kusanoi]|uniref:Uncharacterized protein n=1 Tax=Curvularia kusanoi TaxID=90978 RepID=A0A9P4W626_CURKU|nr:hypothetical protein E8E13_000190 [Curvularia kusanoi]